MDDEHEKSKHLDINFCLTCIIILSAFTLFYRKIIKYIMQYLQQQNHYCQNCD